MPCGSSSHTDSNIFFFRKICKTLTPNKLIFCLSVLKGKWISLKMLGHHQAQSVKQRQVEDIAIASHGRDLHSEAAVSQRPFHFLACKALGESWNVNAEKGSAVKYGLEMLKYRVEVVSLVHILWAPSICAVIWDLQGCVGARRWNFPSRTRWTTGGLSLSGSGDQNWVLVTEHGSLCILKNPGVGNEVIWESSLLISSH